jgi:chaperonin cofactor prefoldin
MDTLEAVNTLNKRQCADILRMVTGKAGDTARISLDIFRSKVAQLQPSQVAAALEQLGLVADPAAPVPRIQAAAGQLKEAYKHIEELQQRVQQLQFRNEVQQGDNRKLQERISELEGMLSRTRSVPQSWLKASR